MSVSVSRMCSSLPPPTPPKMTMLLPTAVAECRERGDGSWPCTTGLSHVMVPVCSVCTCEVRGGGACASAVARQLRHGGCGMAAVEAAMARRPWSSGGRRAHVVERNRFVAAAEHVEVDADDDHRVTIARRRRDAVPLRLRPRQREEQRLILMFSAALEHPAFEHPEAAAEQRLGTDAADHDVER